MSVIGSNILAGASGQGGYFLTNSLRFLSSASAYLNRTQTTPTTATKWTYSYWVKRGTIGGSSVQTMVSGTGGGGSGIVFYNDKLWASSYSGGYQWNFLSAAVYRDTSAWYHIMVAYDSTQATDTNRVKIYVNGVQLTAFTTDVGATTYPSLNSVGFVGGVSGSVRIGLRDDSFYYFDGYLIEVNFVDGQALTPSSFGETSTTTGVWIPKKYTGTYGTNGFYLPFTNTASTSTLGNDFSGNSNTWTVNNISLTAGSTYDSMTDVPTLTSATAANYCVANPLEKGSAFTVSNGNLTIDINASKPVFASVKGTFGITSGKWYWECVKTSSGSGLSQSGVWASDNLSLNINSDLNGNLASLNNIGMFGSTAAGDLIKTGLNSQDYATLGSYTNGDVIGIAFDADSGKLYAYKNGTEFTGQAIGSGTSILPTMATGKTYQPFVYSGNGGSGTENATTNINFGQRPFAYTPPSGFVRLNTFNLPTPTIGATASTTANKYFDSVIWTGDQTNKQIPLNFTADFVWAKRRSGGDSHRLYDVIRGINKDLQSNATDAEQTNDFGLDFDNGNYLAIDGTKYFGGGGGSGTTFVAWNWEANGTGVTNTNGSITSTVSANTTAGFSIVTYTGNGTGGATVGHGLGVAPSMMIFKTRNDTGGWLVWHTGYNSNQAQMLLNSTDGIYNPGNGLYFNSTYPSSTVATLGTSGATNGSGTTYVAYMFAQVAGYSAFGSYTGNGSSDGPFIYTGFRPAFIMIRSTGSPRRWLMFDDSRFPNNGPNMPTLQANLSDAESTNTENYGDFLSNGFKCRATNGNFNGSGETYIYMMFAENPFKYANAR